MVQKIHEDFSDRVQFVTGSLTHYEIDTGDTAITDAKTAWDNAIVVEANAKTAYDSEADDSPDKENLENAWKEAEQATIDARRLYKETANNKGRHLVNTIGMRATVVLTGTFGSDTYASNVIHIAVENNSGWNTGAYPYTTSDPEYVENDRTTYLQDMLGGTWAVAAWEY
jgi:hypothetical protein